MKVIFCIPALSGTLETRCHQSLVSTYAILARLGIAHDEFIIENSSCLPDARTIMQSMVMADPDATDMFQVDSDVGFDAAGAVRMIQRPEEFIGGVYPLKRELIGWPVAIKTEDGIPLGRDGVIEADYLPGGFMRIKRAVLEKMRAAYPELKYTSTVTETTNANVTEMYDLYRMGFAPTGLRIQEDFAFCKRWTDIGGRLWVYPDITFEHVGKKAFSGNYHQYLMRQPGGSLEGK